MTSVALALLLKYCLLFDVPVHVAKAVAKVESNYDNTRIGAHGEIGMFQILPRNYPNVNLRKLENNIKYGVLHLAESKKKCKHQVDYTYLICYNLGVEGARKVKYPKKFPYYGKVMKNVREL